MQTITQMRDDVKALLKELGDMKAKAASENRNPDDEERKLANSHLTKIDELEDLIKLEERTQATIDRTKEPTEPPDKTAVDTTQDKTDQQKRDSFASPGEFYQAVMRAGSPGGSVDPRLSVRAASGLQEGISSDGGFLVETQMAPGMLKNVWDASPILSRVSKVTLGGNKNAMTFNGFNETSRADGSRQGGILGYWKGEADEKTKSKPAFRIETGNGRRDLIFFFRVVSLDRFFDDQSICRLLRSFYPNASR
jgi:HK97 family phage major capsid protein